MFFIFASFRVASLNSKVAEKNRKIQKHFCPSLLMFESPFVFTVTAFLCGMYLL